MGLSDNEIQTLIDRYRQPDGLINYTVFLDKLNSVFSSDVDLSATIQSVKAQAVSKISYDNFRISPMTRKKL